MTVIVLDPRFPTAIPLEAAGLLTGEVCYTEEVPIRVRWAIADAGGHSVTAADVLVTTDERNEEVEDRIAAGEDVFRVGLEEASGGVAAAGGPSAGSAGEPVAEGSGQPAAAGSADGAVAAEGAPAAGARPDSLSDAWSGAPVNSSGAGDGRFPRLAEAIDVMAAARARGEWEAGQTHASLLPYLIEETFEFVDAVNEDGDIVGELSDLLLQVLFHAEIGEGFGIEDVAAAFVEKMRVRQPYLFGDEPADGGLVPVDEQERAWAEGRGGPRSRPAEFLPALALAEETIRRARAAGIPDTDIPVELMCPTPGLELESGAEARTRAVARQFLADLERAEEAYRQQQDALHGGVQDPDHGEWEAGATASED